VTSITVEATGETVSEAKWKALRELERLEPSVDKAAVRFQVLEEGKRGLLGVGSAPARVVATADAAAPEQTQRLDESDLAAHLRELLTHVTTAIGLRCRIEIEETDDAVTAVCSAGDLGLLIGRHGQTIDAVQTLANAILRQEDDARKQVTVDAAGYRDRRRRTVESLALRSAEEAVRSGDAVALEPMSAVERRLVHERLKEYPGVETSSEGEEPNRYVVVTRRA
jgi:spoIIIJ-associated protein